MMMNPSSNDFTPLPPDFARLSALATVQRFSVAEIASQAITPQLESIAFVDRLAILKALASLYSTLGYSRKRASVVAEIAALLSDSFRRAKEANNVLPQIGGVIRSTPKTEGNQAIIHLLERVCEAYGIEVIDKLIVGSKEAANKRRQSVIGLPNPEISLSNKASFLNEESEMAVRFGWPALQVAVIRDAVYMAGMISGRPTCLACYLLALNYRTLQSIKRPCVSAFRHYVD